MTTHYLFADEAGDFAWDRPSASRYFVLCSVTMERTDIGQELLQLRREVVLAGHKERRFLHAAADPWPLRRAVFGILARYQFRIDVTLIDKTLLPDWMGRRPSATDLYRHAWWLHLDELVPSLVEPQDQLLLTAALLDTNRARASFRQAIHDAAMPLLPKEDWAIAFLPSAEDPCLWAADYATWAVQRRFETGDVTAYRYVEEKIASMHTAEDDDFFR